MTDAHTQPYLLHRDTNRRQQSILQQLQWKSAFTLILWGLTLMMLQFQYLMESAFLLPAVGAMLTVLGFYRLRGENQAMYRCYQVSLLAVVLYPIYLLCITTPLVLVNELLIGFQIFLLLYQLTLLLLFHSGMKQMFQQIERRPSGNPLLLLLLWLILQQAIGYTSYANSMAIWLLFVCIFLLFLWIVWMNASSLYNDGYVVTTKMGIVSTGWCMGAYAVVIGLLMLSGTVFTLFLYF